jgi:hypothetical protein
MDGYLAKVRPNTLPTGMMVWFHVWASGFVFDRRCRNASLFGFCEGKRSHGTIPE